MTIAEQLCDELTSLTDRLAKELITAHRRAALRTEAIATLRQAVRSYLLATPQRRPLAAMNLDTAMINAKAAAKDLDMIDFDLIAERMAG